MGRYERYTQAFTSGLKSAFAPFDTEGPAIEVSPFAPGEATTGAGILRAITAVAGARRARANYDAEQRLKGESRYKDSLQTKLLEQKLAEPDYEQQRIDETRRYNDARLGIARDRMTALGKPKPKTATEKAASAALINSAMKDMLAEGERFADEGMNAPRLAPGGKKLPPIANVGQDLARLLKTAKTPTEQLKYARALGVSPKMQTVEDASGVQVAQPLVDANGRYQFESDEISKAITSWMATRRAGLLNQWKSDNAGRLGAYSKALRSMAFGDVDEPADPLEEAALELFGDE